MNTEQAMELAHQLHKKYSATHCSDSACQVCAVVRLSRAVSELRSTNTQLRRVLDLHELQREEQSAKKKLREGRFCSDCGMVTHDGICGRCDL